MINTKILSRLSSRHLSLTLNSQNGSALIIGLLLLLVITIIAVSGVRESLMQERMSGNWHDRNLAFQASEAALREGERWLNQATANQNTAEGHSHLALPSSWEGADAHGSIALDNSDVTYANDPMFYINPPSFHFESPDNRDLTSGCLRVYPVFSHGVGGSANARVTLQANFRPPMSAPVDCPDEWSN